MQTQTRTNLDLVEHTGNQTGEKINGDGIGTCISKNTAEFNAFYIGQIVDQGQEKIRPSGCYQYITAGPDRFIDGKFEIP